MIALLLSVIAGCRDGTAVQSVTVANRTGSTLTDVRIEFDEAIWSREFGVLGKTSATEVPKTRLDLPQFATVHWTIDNKSKSRVVNLEESLKPRPKGIGELIFVINPGERVSTEWRAKK